MSVHALPSLATLSSAFNGIAPLPHLGILRATGADAFQFLHNQLTQDVLLMPSHACRLAAYCNAKGRMQASFVMYKRTDQELLLVTHRDLLAQTLKRLSMFVLRSQVQLSDATDDFQILGMAGGSLSSTPWQRMTMPAGDASADVLALYPALGQPRALWLAPKGAPIPSAPALSTALWQVGEVLSGVAWVVQATFEAFVPQMLNYESVDGVSFKKGCYPGQEVVARSQFRGTLKRRAFIAQSAAAMAAGQEVYSEADGSQPCGLVAQSASDGPVHVAVLELQLSAVQTGTLHLGSANGPALHLHPLPYALREDL